MTTYEVTLLQPVITRAVVAVEARSKREAMRVATAQADTLDFEVCEFGPTKIEYVEEQS